MIERSQREPPAASPAPRPPAPVRAPAPHSPAAVLALQRSAGNQSVVRLLRETAAADPEVEPAAEAEAAAVELEDAGPTEEVERVFAETTEPVEVGGEAHTLSVRMIEGEPTLGVESKWTQLEAIDQQIRAVVNVMGTPYVAAWREVYGKHSKVDAARKALAKEEKAFATLERKWKAKRRQGPEPSGHAVKTAVSTLSLATSSYTGSASRFLRVAYDNFGEQVALILGMLAPTHEKDPLAGGAYAGNRYHTGTALDPIPIIWYKPAANYPPLTLQNLDAVGAVAGPAHVLAYPNWPATVVNYQATDGTMQTASIGVAPANQVTSGAAPDLHNNHPVVSRARQQELNRALVALGFGMGGLDGDHVRDLGFSGTDTDNNFWPLNSVINQNCMLWRNIYRVHFKQLNAAGQWELKSRPIAGLQGKYFRIKGSAAVPNPAESSLPAAGHDATWGAVTPGGILVNGVAQLEA